MRGEMADQHSIELMRNDYLSVVNHFDVSVALKIALSVK
jgi:hypothetical protein